MLKRFLIASCIFSTLWGAPAVGYELATHAKITDMAFVSSNLGKKGSPVPYELGIAYAETGLFGNYYLDVSATEIEVRRQRDFESDVMLSIFKGNVPKDFVDTLRGWLMRGAIREDDSGYLIAGSLFKLSENGEPYDDPYGNINRWCNHFFDPVNNAPLSHVCPISDKKTAPNWASGSVDAFINRDAPDTGRRNHFSLVDAHEAMWRALTLTMLRPDGSLVPLTPPAPIATLPALRKAYWATLFRSLGDVLHLNEDMAQPQHTRDEAHGGGPYDAGGHKSVFEGYIDAIVIGDPEYSKEGVKSAGRTPYPDTFYTSYVPPSFLHYSDYWSSAHGKASATGTGLADYSNHGFFTAGNNIGDTKYADPSPVATSYASSEEILAIPPTLSTPYATVKFRYLKASVVDHLRADATVANQHMVTESAWGFLGPKTYAMNRTVYDDMANLLLPRAVGYAAGILNYFFRGSLRIDAPSDGIYAMADHATATGFVKLRAKVTNTTPDITDSASGTTHKQDMRSGTAVAVLKYHLNTCYTADLTGEYGYSGNTAGLACRAHTAARAFDEINDAEDIVVSKPQNVSLASGASQELTFDFSSHPIPLGASDFYLQVVWRGALGDDSVQEKDAVVVTTKDISEPSYFAFMNTTDYISIAHKLYTIDQIAADQTLMGGLGSSYKPCLTGASGSYSLNKGCAPLQPYNITFTLKMNTTDAAISVTNLAPRQYTRIALLLDPASTGVALSLTGAGFSRADTNLGLVAVRQFATSKLPDGYYPTLRGIPTFGSVFISVAGDALEPPGFAPSDGSDKVMTPLAITTKPTAVNLNPIYTSLP